MHPDFFSSPVSFPHRL